MNGKVNEKFLSFIPSRNHRSFDNPMFVSDDEKIQSPQSAIGNLFKFIQNYLSPKIGIFKFLRFLNYY